MSPPPPAASPGAPPFSAWPTSPGVGVLGTTSCLGHADPGRGGASPKNNRAVSLLKQNQNENPSTPQGLAVGPSGQPDGPEDLSRASLWPQMNKGVLAGRGLATHSGFTCTSVSSRVTRPPSKSPVQHRKPGQEAQSSRHGGPGLEPTASSARLSGRRAGPTERTGWAPG